MACGSTVCTSGGGRKPSMTRTARVGRPAGFRGTPSRGGALGQELLEKALRIRRELAEHDAHARRVLVHTHDLTRPFNGLDIVHDDGEAQIDLRSDAERGL